MTTIEIEQKISDVLSGGEICCRELRLTEEEARYLRAHYPGALTDLGGQWYQLQIKRGLFS